MTLTFRKLNDARRSNLMELKACCFTVGFCAFVLLPAGCNSGNDKPDDLKAIAEVRPSEILSDASGNASLPFAMPVVREMRVLRDDDWFEDRASDLEIDFSYHDGSDAGCYQLLESVGGGVAVLDYDGDSWADLFFTGGGSLAKDDNSILIEGRAAGLFRNCDAATMANVTALAGMNTSATYTHGVTVADLNADGFQDVIVAGFGALQVWINTGDGAFAEQSEYMGLQSDAWNVSPVAADINNDGLVDIYVMTYTDWQPDSERVCLNDKQLHDICGPTMFPGTRDLVLANNGQRFVDISLASGIVSQNRGLGVVAADLDDNGFIDFCSRKRCSGEPALFPIQVRCLGVRMAFWGELRTRIRVSVKDRWELISQILMAMAARTSGIPTTPTRIIHCFGTSKGMGLFIALNCWGCPATRVHGLGSGRASEILTAMGGRICMSSMGMLLMTGWTVLIFNPRRCS